MLTITRSHNAESATDYFTNALSTEGYYLEDDIKAVWLGKTANRLGLEGKIVTKENFSNLVSNKHPKTKERLTVRNVENRRSGFDLTFSCVKSVSVLYGLTKDQKILDAHRFAYKKAMLEVERDIQTQANTKNKRVYQTTGNLIYAAFDHFTSRPNELEHDGESIFISDPQLHTHCYVPNVTWNAEKQRYQAVEIGNVHRLATYYESVYHAHLSKELTKLGFAIERNENRYEIAGVSRSIIERFSNRTLTIEKAAKEKGITDPKAKANLGVLTRHSKAKAIKEEELFRYWKERLSAKEYEELIKLKTSFSKTEPRLSAKQAVSRSIEHFEERQSAYQEKRVLAHALSLGYGYLLPDDLKKELDSRTNILEAEIDSVRYLTTTEMVRAEDQMIRLATIGKAMQRPINPEYKPEQDFLNEQQREAIAKVLQSNDKVIILKGSAGVGKTSSLLEVDKAVTKSGKKLFAVAPSSGATKVLSDKGFKANTISGLLAREQQHKDLQGQVLLIDEAGMVGVKTMSKLLQLGEDYNARIILSGDTKQHNSVEFGDSLRILEEKARLKTIEIGKIVRQKPEQYRNVVEQLSKGNITKGYGLLDTMGAIKEIPEHEKRMETIANDYINSIEQNKSALIISPTHYEGDMINSLVRKKLKDKGRITGKDRDIKILKNLSFTESQKKDTKLYREGQIIRFIRNQKGGYKAGEHYKVLPPKPEKPLQIQNTKTKEVLPLNHQSPENYQVFDTSTSQFAKGDSIRITQNSKSLENTKLTNGTVYKIEGFTRSGDIKLHNKKTLSKDNLHAKHAYTDTSYSSQGKDAKEVYISMSDLSFGGASKEQFYVSVSRGTHKAMIYTSDKTELKKSIHKSSERISAKEIVSLQNEHRQLSRYQRNYHQSLNKDILRQKDKQITKSKDTSFDRD